MCLLSDLDWVRLDCWLLDVAVSHLLQPMMAQTEMRQEGDDIEGNLISSPLRPSLSKKLDFFVKINVAFVYKSFIGEGL